VKIIDFERKGNQVKFYLGKDNLDKWWGDDWDDTPYEHNAGTVYSEFVESTQVVNFDMEDVVAEPCAGRSNSPWCKGDMLKRKVPCVVVLQKDKIGSDEIKWQYEDSFEKMLANANAMRIYMGDSYDVVSKK
jgi:hypothetical protein